MCCAVYVLPYERDSVCGMHTQSKDHLTICMCVGTLNSIPDVCEEDWCVSYICHGEEGKTYNGATDCADAIGAFLVKVCGVWACM